MNECEGNAPMQDLDAAQVGGRVGRGRLVQPRERGSVTEFRVVAEDRHRLCELSGLGR
jgi:hypothetical protein